MAAILLAGEAVGIGVTFATRASNPVLSQEFAAGSAALFFGALLGGVAKMLIDDFDRRRVRRAADIDYIINILSELKGVYDRVDRGRTLISAHQSAKTYGDEMRNFIEARVRLLQIARALRFDERRSAVDSIRIEVDRMEGYLKLLVEEFQAKYKEISRTQDVYEARMKKALDQVSLSEASGSPLPTNTPWNSVKELGQVRDLLEAVPGKSGYSREFLAPLDAASEELRKALSAKYGRAED
jgi:hypothetical protein